MLKYTIMFAAVAGLVFALAPAAQGVIPYVEDWQNVHVPVNNPHPDWAGIGPYNLVSGANVPGLREWHWANDNSPPANTVVEMSANGNQHGQGVSYEWEDLVPLPGGDDWRYNGPSDSGNVFLYTNPGRGAPSPVVLAAERNSQTQMSIWYSESGNLQMQLAALVGGSWYFTDSFGGDITLKMISGTGGNPCRVREWKQFVQEVENDNWYLWTNDGVNDPDDPKDYYNRDAGTGMPSCLVGATAISLPVGNIDEIAIQFNKLGNGDIRALDDYVVIPEPATMALLAFGGLAVLLRRKRR